MKRYLATLFLLLLPIAVLAKPEVIQLSPDTYMITKADHGGIFGGGIPKLKTAVIKQANEFAASQGKIAIPLASSEHPMGNGPARWATFEYQFRVVDKTDPEARRTSLAPVPDTVVSIEGKPSQPSSPHPSKQDDRVDDLYSKLLKLDDLRERSLISEAEFEAEKRRLLEN